MAYWITHIMIADQITAYDQSIDKEGFCIGSIAPDCNIESPDWLTYDPPRERTHFMNGKSKTTANYDEFYNQYIANKRFSSNHEKAFLLGYYAHLITDVEYTKFLRDEKRVKQMYERLRSDNKLKDKLIGKPETFDTIKICFGKEMVLKDIVRTEQKYLTKKPNSLYNTVLRKTTVFPDYLDFLPHGAIARKIPIMAKQISEICNACMLFFTEDEYMSFVDKTADLIYQKMIYEGSI